MPRAPMPHGPSTRARLRTALVAVSAAAIVLLLWLLLRATAPYAAALPPGTGS